MKDEPAPREQGLQLGREYALRWIDDRAKLRRVVRAQTAEEVKANIDWTSLAGVDHDRPVAFWSGFAHGIREVLVDEAAAVSDHPTRSRPGAAST